MSILSCKELTKYYDGVQALNNLFDAPLVEAQPGGRSGGVASVTARGRAVIEAFGKVEAELGDTLARLQARLEADGELGELFWSLGMKTSARNAVRGVVSAVTDGAVNTEVTLQVAEGVDIVSIVTRQSVADLDLAVGKPAVALIKSSFVVLAKGEGLGACDRWFGHVAHAWLIGEAAANFARAIGDHVPVTNAVTLDAAVSMAASVAQPGDVVLLSPAAASLDQFRDFEARGDAFRDAVAGLDW